MLGFRRLVAASTLCALALGMASSPTNAALPKDWIYPSGLNDGCNTTLADCISTAHVGDTVTIETSTSIDEDSLQINKSLTLNAGTGVEATISKGILIVAGGTNDVINVDGINFGGQVHVVEASGSGHLISLSNLYVYGNDVLLQASVSAQGTLSIAHSLFSQGATTGIHTDVAESPVMLTVEPTANTTVDFIANTIAAPNDSQSAGGGVQWLLGHSGNITARMMNNTVWGTSGPAVQAYAQGSGHDVLDLVGNTFEKIGGAGISVDNSVVAGSVTSVNAFNNIVSHAHAGGVAITDHSPAARLVLSAGYSDYYSNTGPNMLGGRSLGSHNLAVNPGYTNTLDANLTLKSTSSLINKGIVCSPGGIAISDADGHARLKGSTVDIGAFEKGAGAVTGVALVGTSGPDTLDGTSGADIICGYGDNDVVNGEAGNDYLDGGDGQDNILGLAGNDKLLGEAGNDHLCAMDGVKGNDTVVGGPGTDTYIIDKNDSVSSVETKLSGCG